ALQPERNQSYTPLFQVFFVLQNTPMPNLEMSGVVVRPFEIDNGTAKFDLTLSLAETAEGLAGWIEYATDLFDADRMARLAGHLRTIIDEVIANPNARLSQLSPLTAGERQQLLVEWNQTAADYPQQTLHALFEEQARRSPERTALEFERKRWTYAELDAQASRIAARLRALGIGPDRLVGLCVERSPQMVAGVLGILKAGGAYVPLDPDYPQERLAFVLEDARVSAVLTQRSLVDLVRGLGAGSGEEGRILCVDEISESDLTPESGDGNRACSNNLAYVIYTSGSTGKPKGVQIEHRSVVNFLESMRRVPGLGEEDVLVAVTTLSFDIAGLELLLPLTTGARVVLASRETASDGQALAG
ncbi:MAG TPA: AMP-binding protein, partial [Candidatus Dormibacteraeota bacterium]|nr:AMP-binding protein [Candidatus Dormibacteraeota bacterium]